MEAKCVVEPVRPNECLVIHIDWVEVRLIVNHCPGHGSPVCTLFDGSFDERLLY